MGNGWPKRGPKNVSTMADYIGRYVLLFMVATTDKCLSQDCLRYPLTHSVRSVCPIYRTPRACVTCGLLPPPLKLKISRMLRHLIHNILASILVYSVFTKYFRSDFIKVFCLWPLNFVLTEVNHVWRRG